MTRPGMVARVLLLLTLAGSTALPAQPPVLRVSQAADSAELVTAPVVVDGVVLFRVRGVSSLPPAERARLVQRQIVTVAADARISIDSLRVVEIEGASQIRAGDVAVFTIVDADAQMERLERTALAGAHLYRIRQAITDYRVNRTTSAVRQSATRAVLATLAFALATVLLIGLTGRLARFIDDRLHTTEDPSRTGSYQVLRAVSLGSAVRGLLGVLRTVAVVGVTFVWLGFVLAQFPASRGISRNLLGIAVRPLTLFGSGVVNSLPSLVFLAVLFVLFRLLLRLLRLFFLAVERGTVRLANFDPEWAQPTYKIVRVALIAFAIIVAYPYIPGSQTAVFKGVSLFAGVLFSLGSSSVIANIVAGYALIYRRAFRLGDRICAGEYTGDVIKSRLQVTHLRTIKNEEVVIPNSRLLSSDVLNYSTLARVHGLVLHTDVSIGYDTSWRQVEALLIQAAERTRELGPDPRPYVQLKKLGDFAVQYELNVHCADVHAMQALYSALHRNILDVFNEAGVQIMTPVYEGDPPQPKIVPPEAWYPPPVVRSAVAAGRDGPRPPPDEQAHQSPLAAAPPNRT